MARTLEVIGDRWTMLVVRDVFLGLRRFDDIQRDLGVARNVLADRLGRLVDEGILERRRYQERPARHEYRLTEKGLDLWPVMLGLMKWGDKHAPADGGPPSRVIHRDCGGEVNERLTCEACGAAVDVAHARVERRPDLVAASTP